MQLGGPRSRSISIAVEGEKYLTELLNSGRSELTVRTYDDRLRWFSEWLAAVGCPLGDVSQGTVQQWIADQRARGLAPKTIHDNIGAVQSFFKWLEQAQLVGVDPLRRLRPFKVPRRLPQVLPVAEVDQILAAATAPRDRVIIELAYGCALRTSELVALDLGHVDLAGAVALIQGKGGHQRYVPLNSHAIQAIRVWLPARLEILAGGTRRAQAAAMRDRGMSYREISAAMKISVPVAVQYVMKSRKKPDRIRTTEALLVGQRGRLKPSCIRAIVKAIAADAGLRRRVYPHLFRHSCATHMLDGGADTRHVQELLGHASLATTQIYTHVAIGGLRRVYEKTHPRARPSKNLIDDS